jgi:hypothetical protein
VLLNRNLEEDRNLELKFSNLPNCRFKIIWISEQSFKVVQLMCKFANFLSLDLGVFECSRFSIFRRPQLTLKSPNLNLRICTLQTLDPPSVSEIMK